MFIYVISVLTKSELFGYVPRLFALSQQQRTTNLRRTTNLTRICEKNIQSFVFVYLKQAIFLKLSYAFLGTIQSCNKGISTSILKQIFICEGITCYTAMENQL